MAQRRIRDLVCVTNETLSNANGHPGCPGILPIFSIQNGMYGRTT